MECWTPRQPILHTSDHANRQDNDTRNNFLSSPSTRFYGLAAGDKRPKLREALPRNHGYVWEPSSFSCFIRSLCDFTLLCTQLKCHPHHKFYTYIDVCCWRSTTVMNREKYRKSQFRGVLVDNKGRIYGSIDRKPSSVIRNNTIASNDITIAHSVSGLAGVFDGFAGKYDLFVKKDGSDRRNQNGSGGGDDHPERPKRAGLLGSEIAYLMVLAGGGLGVCYGAFNRAGKARNIWQTLGWAAVVVLTALIASYSLILLLVGTV